MLFASTPIVFAYHFSLTLFTERRSVLSRITVAEHCVFALMSFFSSALLGGAVDAAHDFEVVTALVESGVLLSFAECCSRICI